MRRRHCQTMSGLSSGEKYLFATRLFMPDSVGVKLNKTKKIDVRLDQELFDLVDNYAQASRLSRSQVVERALLQLFGRPVEDSPIHQGKANPPDSVGVKTLRASESFDSTPSTATTKSSHPAG